MNLISNQFFLKIYSKFFATSVGQDEYGNKYYSVKNNSPKNNYRERRWVIYNGEIEASKVPQRWNAWASSCDKRNTFFRYTKRKMDEKSFTKFKKKIKFSQRKKIYGEKLSELEPKQ